MEPDVYDAYLNVDGKRHPAGRFMTHGGQTKVVSDYHNGALANALQSGQPNGLEYVSRTAHRDGHALHAVPEAELNEPLAPEQVPVPQAQQAIRPPSVFHYHRTGMDKPHVVEFSGGKGVFDGHPLTDDETTKILTNVRSGVANLRYKSQAPAMMKAEQAFRLMKEEEDQHIDPQAALGHLDRLVQQGHLDPAVAKSIRKTIYEDRMTPGIGSKLAADEFLSQKKPGVYVSLDGNSLGAMNKIHGQHVGDQAIKSFGQALRESMDPSTGKLFRSGGDEFLAHVPTHEHAVKFARNLRDRLAQMPAVGGTHNLSMSMGIGPSVEHANQALIHAKQQRFHTGSKDLRFIPGEEPTFAHSLMPGAEGPVPLDPEQLPLTKLPDGVEVKMPEEPTSTQPQPAPAPNHLQVIQ